MEVCRQCGLKLDFECYENREGDRFCSEECREQYEVDALDELKSEVSHELL